jgi:hypothetical protein
MHIKRLLGISVRVWKKLNACRRRLSALNFTFAIFRIFLSYCSNEQKEGVN